MKARKLRLALILMPYTFIALLPVINVARISVFGIPFLWFWSFLWVVLITIIITILYLIEIREGRKGV
ncbi:MAG: hypothetical protein DRO15_03720 [Thermoprotei archaeon]|nr:MAG: hypothetical protein DRO15_03720 [Thermoprotei archaeon]